jgi:hypothetical protein
MEGNLKRLLRSSIMKEESEDFIEDIQLLYFKVHFLDLEILFPINSLWRFLIIIQ